MVYGILHGMVLHSMTWTRTVWRVLGFFLFWGFFLINIYFQEAFSQSDFQKGPEIFRKVLKFPERSCSSVSNDKNTRKRQIDRDSTTWKIKKNFNVSMLETLQFYLYSSVGVSLSICRCQVQFDMVWYSTTVMYGMQWYAHWHDMVWYSTTAMYGMQWYAHWHGVVR
jgi:hypothetical protein